MVDRMNLWIQLRRYFRMVGRRWPLLLVGAILGGGGATYRAYQKEDQFEAYSTLAIDYKIETSANRSQARALEANFYDSQVTFMNGGKVISDARQRVQNDPDYSHLAGLQPTYTRASNIGDNSAAFRMVVQSGDPEFSRVFAEKWALAFIDFKRQRVKERFSSEAVTINEHIDKIQRELSLARADLDAFQIQHQIASGNEVLNFLQQEYDKTLRERNELETQLGLLKDTPTEKIAEGGFSQARPQVQTNTTEGEEKTIANTEDTYFMNFNDGAIYRQLMKQKIPLENELQSLSTVLRTNHPHFIYLRDQIKSIEEKMSIELDFIQKSRSALIEQLEKRLLSLNQIIDQRSTEVFEAQKVQGDYDEKISTVGKLQNRLDTLRLALEELDRGQTEGEVVVTEAGVGGYQIWGDKDRHKMILFGVLIGLGVGLGIAYFLNQLDDRLELASEIEEALEEPVLGQIPQVNKEQVKKERLLITELSQNNMFAEAVRGVRSAVMLGIEGGPKQLIIVSSATPGDGKTTFSVNFAATLAIAGHRVLLIDADMRRGNIHAYFNLTREPGLSDILMGNLHWSDAIQETGIGAMQILNTGGMPPNPGELLVNPIMQQLLVEVKQDYDYIVMDCPPLTAIDDTYSIANQADGMLFVVRAGVTSMRFARAALDSVRQRGARILGVVLNGVTSDNPYYYYNHYYHAYYSKSEKSDKKENLITIQATRMASPKGRKKAQPLSIMDAAKKFSEAQKHESAEDGEIPNKDLPDENSQKQPANKSDLLS